ncbi:phytanoyl-CoA dioxygenase family protein [Micromonospora sp. NPDC050980]|uniref:phytanoyl-CoA dioxygenase family protein n=1 Tax=Micromonospora sp. NPDC050980 TaxID=3155161 RepID=UPI0033C9D608
MTNPFPVDVPVLPTPDDIAAYRRDGFLVVRGLIPPGVLDAAERGMARFYAGDLDAPFPGRTRHDDYDWTPAHGGGLRKNDYTSRMVVELAHLVEFPAIGAYAAALAGAAGIRLWHDQLLYKPAGLDDARGNVGWHTDRQYWLSCSSTEMLTCWVPFHDCDESVGGVSFVAGSHRWPPQRGLDFFAGDLTAQEASFRPAGAAARKVVPVLRRGDVTFHHCGTVHGSGPNLADRPRRSMAIHLQPADNHWVPATDPAGAPAFHRNDELVRSVDGHPDYADSRISPMLWPARPPVGVPHEAAS